MLFGDSPRLYLKLPCPSTRFRPYGSLKYCKLTLDRETGRPRGTGFIHFWKKEDADKVLAEAELAAAMMTSRTVAEKKAAGGVVSQLVPETTSGFWLHGRQIFLMAAVDRSTAHKLDEEKSEKIASDGRNLHLLKEGYIRAGSQAALDLKPGELAKREGSFQDRKRKILKHPHLFISTTRLSVRNLAKGVDEKQLRDLATKCAKEWVAEVTAMEKENRLGRTERLELIRLKKEGNNIRGRVFVKQAKIVRDKTAVDLKAIAKQQPKTSLASADATAAAVAAVDKKKLIGVSKGYGFVEFTSHAHALGCLRRMNNNPDLLPGGRRLMVEFAIENKSILSKRESRGKPEAGDKDVEAPKAIDCKKDKKRKRDGEQQGDGAVAAGDIKKAKKGKKDGADEKKKPSAKGQPSRSDKKGPSSTAIVTSGKPVHTRTTTSTSSSPSSTAATPATKPKKQTQKRKPAKADAFDDLVNKYKQKLVGGSCTVDAAAPKKAAGRWFD